MTPDDFITTWAKSELKESAGAASHFNDLCALLGVDPPHKADPNAEWFTFEKGATKAVGNQGWADVWRRDCFAWEYKGKRKDLDKAFMQLQNYAGALGNPPLLIVSDMDTIRIHTNWTNTISVVHTLTLQDLRDGAKRDLLRNCFVNPNALKPTETRQALTEKVAENFAAIAERLRKRGHDPQEVAHFVNRLVFCMFAEDVGLLPNKLFETLIKNSRGAQGEKDFPKRAANLFETMRRGGFYGNDEIDMFNGGLFENDATLPLTYQDLDDLYRITQPNWSDIDPSILGTLFERGLDPDKRSQLGAHYTDRDKIMQIITPVIIQPLLAEWAEVRAQIETLLPSDPAAAQSLRAAFAQRLANFRVLDPACGSGNFLYLSLIELKNIEHRMNVEAESLGLPKALPKIGPESVLGIELNPYAAELARVSVWIGEIQWMRRNGFDVAKNPILRSLNTIENRDAVLGTDGGRAPWPRADVIVGNPPFLGNKKMIRELGEHYTTALRAAYGSSGVDLVCYWFVQAWAQIAAGQTLRAGLVATNSIRGGANREVLKPIVEGGRIFNAWADEPWTVDGAAVRVSMLCFDGEKGGAVVLEGQAVPEVFSDLTAGKELNLAQAAKLNENNGVSFQGVSKVGNFEIDGETARSWLSFPLNPNGKPNSDVLRPWLTGVDLTARNKDEWIVDFGLDMSIIDASLYEAPFTHLEISVRPKRLESRRDAYRTKWWIHAEARPGMRKAMQNLQRLIVTPKMSKHRFFVFVPREVLPSNLIIAVGRGDDTTFGILSSRIHEVWSLSLGQWLGAGNDPTYTPSTTFETFPFPAGLTPNIPAADYAANPHAQAIAVAAADLNAKREFWLNPPDLTIRTPEVVAGYPDRILPKDAAAEKELKTRTLTNLYNLRPTWLVHLHQALDQAVANAYGWGDDWAKGMSDDEILSRLFALNQARAAAQG